MTVKSFELIPFIELISIWFLEIKAELSNNFKSLAKRFIPKNLGEPLWDKTEFFFIKLQLKLTEFFTC